MSYFVDKKSSLVFGNGGINASMLDCGYVCTLCLSCSDKATGEESFVDLHFTADQLLSLSNRVCEAYRDYVFPPLKTSNPGESE